MKKLFISFLLSFASSLVAANTLTVYSTNYPLHYFAQRIGGAMIEPIYIIPDQIDPAFWQPDTNTIQAFQQSDVILLNGAGYEKWLTSVSLPRRKLVNTSQSFKSEYLHVKKTMTHNHGYDGAHSHQGTAFTTWMDLSQAQKQAQAIKTALSIKRPEQAQMFEKNFQSLSQDLEALDKDWMRLFQSFHNQTLLASHPVYQYLARRYELTLHSLQWEPDSYPDESQWQDLTEHLKQFPIKWMLWEDKPLEKTKARLITLGVATIVFSPAGNQLERTDWLGVMKQNTKALEQVLKK